MLALVVEFRIKAAHVDAFDAAIRANAQASVDLRQFEPVATLSTRKEIA